MTGLGVLEYKRLRAPKEHGGVLIEPSVSSCPQLLATNLKFSEQNQTDWQGKSSSALKTLAQAELLQCLREYAADNETSFDWKEQAPIVAAGHQPALYHPGVWFKNFVLDRAASECSANAVNVLIDNDLFREPSLRVPELRPVRLRTVRLDESDPVPLPYECRSIIDLPLFESFGARLTSAVAEWNPHPVVAEMWPVAVESARRSRNLGLCIATARHSVERKIGLRTAEVPLSRLCQGRAFSWFSAHLLANAPRFWDVYNESLRDYRSVNKVRSRSHPVPDLGMEDRWLEMPFWLWNSQSPIRRAAYVRSLKGELELSDLHGTSIRLDLCEDSQADTAIEQLEQACREGIQLRPRAILTTMVLRLMLSDLFIHGIGGAKYDELTDEIIRRFCGVPAPEFVVATATAHLPLAIPASDEQSRREIVQSLRQLTFQPERFVGEDTPGAKPWIDKKEYWIAKELPRGGRLERHQGIHSANEALQPFVATKRLEMLAERQRIDQMLRERSVLASREYSFCAFPFETLPGFLLELLSSGT